MTIVQIPTCFRGRFLSGLLVAVVGLALAGPTAAQERATVKTIDKRLLRVEKVLDQSLLSLLQRIDSLQQTVRTMSGEMESLRYELEKQQERNRELYRDTDRRMSALEARPVVDSSADDDFLEGGGLDEVDGGLGDEVGDASGGARYVDPTQVATVSSDENDPLAPQVPVRASTTRAATKAEKGAYSNAYDLLARGENPSAVAAFDQFLREFPDGPFSDNAWYWQGEAHYATRQFDRARKNFTIVVSSFPESAKVPDARLKIGYSLYEQGRYSEARDILVSVQDDYPGRSASVLARKRLQKMDREGN